MRVPICCVAAYSCRGSLRPSLGTDIARSGMQRARADAAYRSSVEPSTHRQASARSRCLSRRFTCAISCCAIPIGPAWRILSKFGFRWSTLELLRRVAPLLQRKMGLQSAYLRTARACHFLRRSSNVEDRLCNSDPGVAATRCPDSALATSSGLCSRSVCLGEALGV